MPIDFKRLATTCIYAETIHLLSQRDGDALMTVGLDGNCMGDHMILMLSGPPGKPDLVGKPIRYLEEQNMTIVAIKCKDTRAFFSNMGWVLDDFDVETKRKIH